MPVRMCLCVSLASDSSKTVEVIIVKLGTVTASDVVMHHVLIMLTLIFIQGQGHADDDLNHENIKCLIISETVKIVQLKVYNLFLVQ